MKILFLSICFLILQRSQSDEIKNIRKANPCSIQNINRNISMFVTYFNKSTEFSNIFHGFKNKSLIANSTSIDMSRSLYNLEYLCKGELNNYKLLKELNLRNCFLQIVQTGAFSNMLKLKIVDLSDNSLSYIERGEHYYVYK